jgi:peptide/nickel transport system substrate-binding protein
VADGDVDPNGKLTVATKFVIGSEYRIDPALGGSVSWEAIGYLIFGTPLKLDRDGTVQPYLAESYEIPDPQTFKLTLREGLTFQDGQPYTAEAMKEAIEVKLASGDDPKSNYRTGPGTQIATMTVDSPTELTFTMDGPVAGLMPYVMATSWGHVPGPGVRPRAADRRRSVPAGGMGAEPVDEAREVGRLLRRG